MRQITVEVPSGELADPERITLVAHPTMPHVADSPCTRRSAALSKGYLEKLPRPWHDANASTLMPLS
jgi:hypothetical protein